MYTLTLNGDAAWAGARGAFYRTARPLRDARIVEVPPPEGRAIPPGSNRRTQLALWNEVGDDGKLWPQRAIRHAGSHAETLADGTPPLGNWGDDNGDGVTDLGFVCIGPIDYRLKLGFAVFNPRAISSGESDGPGGQEPWPVGEPPVPDGLAASDVPAIDTDGDGVPDPNGVNGGGCHVYIVQFFTEPLAETRTLLDGTGCVIRHFMPDCCYLVTIPDAAALRAVQTLPVVRWSGPYHPAYRLEPLLVSEVLAHDGPQTYRIYNVLTQNRDTGQQRRAARNIQQQGGTVTELFDSSRRFAATMNRAQLLSVLQMDELLFCDRWAEPTNAIDNARAVSGVDFVAALSIPVGGFQGQGVRGEIMDNYITYDHEAWFDANMNQTRLIQHGSTPYPSDVIAPERYHGTCCFGIVFARDPAPPDKRGILPMADGLIWASRFRIGTEISREDHTAELKAAPYFAVFQSNSWGAASTTDYTSVTAELDDIALRQDVLICQAQGNNGHSDGVAPQESFDQAWAKNVVSVGGFYSRNDTVSTNDSWNYDEKSEPDGVPCSSSEFGGGSCIDVNGHEVLPTHCPAASSIGPAADGRVKPDLIHFFDSVRTAYVPQDGPVTDNAYTCGFGGTSCATPITAGLFGILFQMWHQRTFPGFPVNPGATVFDSRPHSTTAKAMLINTAFRYDLNTTDFGRYVQGWGRADVANLWSLRNNLLIVNETVNLTLPGQAYEHQVSVDGSLPLKVTMVYADPSAIPFTSPTRQNDLDLFVMSPSGTGYWGNRGLLSGNWSVAGGANDSQNTVENVWIQNPEAGIWTIRVRLILLGADGNPDTPEYDANFALVASGVGGASESHCGGDWNRDGKITATDLYEFRADYLRGTADHNGDGQQTTEDWFDFINDLFDTGCVKRRD